MSGGDSEEMKVKGLVDGFSPASSTRIFWNSRKRTVNGQSKNNVTEESLKPLEQTEEHLVAAGNSLDPSPSSLSDKRKALFEPLEPTSSTNKLRPANETLLPPPDFDSTSYPKGWLIGKKRKLVNVDVVESMRRIAIQEMNRKDREIDGLNEQLEEDARCVEHMQLQLLQERSKRADLERENGVLKNQISMLMDMLHDPQEPDDELPPDDM